MKDVVPVGLGVLAGAVSAGVWALVTFYMNAEIGFVAWGIGLLVGFVVGATSRGESVPRGVAAVVISVVAIVGGKFGAEELYIRDQLSANAWVVDRAYMVSEVADGMLETEADAWPMLSPAQLANAASLRDTYHPDTWAEAERRYDAMDPTAREALRASSEAELATLNRELEASLREQSWSYMTSGPELAWTALWMGLAGFSAFRLGGAGED